MSDLIGDLPVLEAAVGYIGETPMLQEELVGWSDNATQVDEGRRGHISFLGLNSVSSSVSVSCAESNASHYRIAH